MTHTEVKLDEALVQTTTCLSCMVGFSNSMAHVDTSMISLKHNLIEYSLFIN